MAQVTIYLDDRTDTLLKRHVRHSGESASSWVADAIRRRIANEWPPDVVKLLGSWKPGGCPDAGELRKTQGRDAKRETL